MVDVVTFGEEGVPGPTGPTGPVGPLGGTPDVSGIVNLDPATHEIRGPYTRESAASVPGTGGLASILTLDLGLATGSGAANPRARKLVFELLAQKNDGSKVQTLDGARRIKIVAGVPTLVTSGTDVADDTDALGATFVVEIVNPFAGVYYLRARGTIDAASTLTAAIRELHP